MKLYAFPPSSRVLAIMALKDHLEIECDVQAIDLSMGDQRTPEYAALNPNLKMPMLEDDGFVLWESNAILFHLANKRLVQGVAPEIAHGVERGCRDCAASDQPAGHGNHRTRFHRPQDAVGAKFAQGGPGRGAIHAAVVAGGAIVLVELLAVLGKQGSRDEKQA